LLFSARVRAREARVCCEMMVRLRAGPVARSALQAARLIAITLCHFRTGSLCA
jgi:hypothetical protein